ncbi:uncharacterized protein LY79DRAFT_202914 [Colletotrichum navitas]|uniref:Secreted protein n=1 Tax=Colletotrichum navitas TaxID=681940 RepID=A0AAD8QA91_9PEZI|nr:uncharacterized protein LY79DRAFT_202914 [Colletotrichum navitas]KAK1598905.1 hypothetical protein LY79DRAFT_202914 [Colletotrichum navitas]
MRASLCRGPPILFPSVLLLLSTSLCLSLPLSLSLPRHPLVSSSARGKEYVLPPPPFRWQVFGNYIRAGHMWAPRQTLTRFLKSFVVVLPSFFLRAAGCSYPPCLPGLRRP